MRNSQTPNTLSDEVAAATTTINELRQAYATVEEVAEALREFVEYDAQAEGDQSLGDCDRIWHKAETALGKARAFLKK